MKTKLIWITITLFVLIEAINKAMEVRSYA